MEQNDTLFVLLENTLEYIDIHPGRSTEALFHLQFPNTNNIPIIALEMPENILQICTHTPKSGVIQSLSTGSALLSLLTIEFHRPSLLSILLSPFLTL